MRNIELVKDDLLEMLEKIRLEHEDSGLAFFSVQDCVAADPLGKMFLPQVLLSTLFQDVDGLSHVIGHLVVLAYRKGYEVGSEIGELEKYGKAHP